MKNPSDRQRFPYESIITIKHSHDFDNCCYRKQIAM